MDFESFLSDGNIYQLVMDSVNLPASGRDFRENRGQHYFLDMGGSSFLRLTCASLAMVDETVMYNEGKDKHANSLGHGDCSQNVAGWHSEH